MKKPLLLQEEYFEQNEVTLFHGDRLELLANIRKSGSKAKLIVTSPPYNIGKSYEKVLPIEDYLKKQQETIEQCVAILDDKGSICWQVGNFLIGKGKSKEVFPLDIVLYDVFKKLGLKLRNRIIWHFGHGLHETSRFSGRHETILWFTKDTSDFTFNLDEVRVPQKYPGKRAYRGINKGKPSGNPMGKNPSDVWQIPNVKANHVEKTEHDCQFPIALVQRLVLCLTNENDLVVDPYAGVCSAGVAAILEGRKFAGSDISDRFLKIGVDRIQAAKEGALKIRSLNKPIYVPDPKTAVAALPDEWKLS